MIDSTGHIEESWFTLVSPIGNKLDNLRVATILKKISCNDLSRFDLQQPNMMQLCQLMFFLHFRYDLVGSHAANENY